MPRTHPVRACTAMSEIRDTPTSLLDDRETIVCILPAPVPSMYQNTLWDLPDTSVNPFRRNDLAM